MIPKSQEAKSATRAGPVEKSFDRWLAYIFPIVVAFVLTWAPNVLDPHAYFLYSDSGFPLSPVNYLYEQSNSWNFFANGWGGPIYLFTPLAFFAPIAFLFQLGIPLVVLNRAFYLVPVASIGLSTVYLYRVVGRTEASTVGSLIATAFSQTIVLFSFNPLTTLGAAMFPLELGLVISCLTSATERIMRYAIPVSFAAMLLLLNIPVAYLSLLVIPLFIVSMVVIRMSTWKRAAKLILASVGLMVPLNLYWIVPFLSWSRIGDIIQTANLASGGHAVSSEAQLYSSISELFWATTITGNGNKPALLYGSNPLLAITIIISVCLAFAAIGLTRNKLAPLLVITALTSLIFSTLTHYSPVAAIYSFLTETLPGFAVLYSTVFWFAVAIPLEAVLVGLTTSRLEAGLGMTIPKPSPKWRRRISSAVIALLLLSLLAARSEALYIDTAYATGNPLTEIPSDYFSLAGYLRVNATVDDRLLALPAGLYMTYTWYNSSFEIPSLAAYVSPIPVMGGAAYSTGLQATTIDDITSGEMASFVNGLTLLHVKYVLVYKDLESMNHYQVNLQQVSRLESRYLNLLSSSHQFFKSLDNSHFALFQLQTHQVYSEVSILQADTQGSSDRFSYSNFTGSQYIEADINNERAIERNLTLMGWFNTNSNQSEMIAGKWWSSLTKYASFGLYLNQGKLVAAAENRSFYAAGAVSVSSFNDRQWHFAAMVKANSDVLLYADGVEVANATLNGDLYHSEIPFTVGAFNANTTDVLALGNDEHEVTGFFKGGLMGIQLYNRSLTSDEIRGAYIKALRGNWSASMQGLVLDFLSPTGGGGEAMPAVPHGTPIIARGSLPASLTVAAGPLINSTSIARSESEFSGSFVAGGKTLLILWQDYDSSWLLLVNGQPINSHFTVDGYANAWVFNATGRTDVRIENVPNQYTMFFFGFSIAAVVLLVFYVIASSPRCREIGVSVLRLGKVD